MFWEAGELLEGLPFIKAKRLRDRNCECGTCTCKRTCLLPAAAWSCRTIHMITIIISSSIIIYFLHYDQ